MAVDQTDCVDMIGVDSKSESVVLTIADHLPWDKASSTNHLALLQDKINTYLSFIESGELVERYPDAEGRAAVISIVGQHPLNRDGQQFFQQACSIISDAGMTLEFKVI